MEKNTVLLQDTEAFMHGELDNVTVQQNCIVLDLVQGGYVPYGCYTSAPIPMPLFDALRVSWNAASPEDTAVEAQVRVMVDGNWTTWNSFGKWSPSLHREGPPYQARGPVQRWPDRLQLDSKYATAVQLRIYLYSKNEKVSPAVMLLGASVRMVDVIPSGGRPVNRTLHLIIGRLHLRHSGFVRQSGIHQSAGGGHGFFPCRLRLTGKVELLIQHQQGIVSIGYACYQLGTDSLTIILALSIKCFRLFFGIAHTTEYVQLPTGSNGQ